MNDKRKITEADAIIAEAVFDRDVVVQHMVEGKAHSENGCPWCEGPLLLDMGRSAYSISCQICDFKLVSRGL